MLKDISERASGPKLLLVLKELNLGARHSIGTRNLPGMPRFSRVTLVCVTLTTTRTPSTPAARVLIAGHRPKNKVIRG